MASEITEAQALATALGKPTEPPLILRDNPIPIEPLCIDQISEILLSIDRLAERGLLVDSLFLPSSPPATAGGSHKSYNYTQLVLRGGNDFRNILATASKQSSAFVGSLNILEVAKLAGRIWKVNKDFFGENQIEILQAFGLEESHLAELKNTFASIKSLVTSAPEESLTSEASPSEKSIPSPDPSSETN